MNFVSLRLFAAVIIALALTILPLPEVLLGLRPPWVLILILYWQFFCPIISILLFYLLLVWRLMFYSRLFLGNMRLRCH